MIDDQVFAVVHSFPPLLAVSVAGAGVVPVRLVDFAAVSPGGHRRTRSAGAGGRPDHFAGAAAQGYLGRGLLKGPLLKQAFCFVSGHEKEWGFSVCVRTPEFGKPEGRTADPSTTLRSGRDDNSSWKPYLAFPKQNCHPDRSVA